MEKLGKIKFVEGTENKDIKTLLKNLKTLKKENGNCKGLRCIECPLEYIEYIDTELDCADISMNFSFEKGEAKEDEIAIWQYNVKKIKKALKKLDTNKTV